ncbi:MAG: PIN domain-containing protein [Bacteroidia bacterium]|nr:PIN domain-containing protein [Bacteroidia bacterium]
MRKILLDTDVILDFLFDRTPFANSAAEILAMCESKEIKGYLTAVIISNLYYLLRQTATHGKVIEKLSKLISITEILVTDKKMVIRALKSEFKDFEDALQNYTAELDGHIDLIVTRNTKDFKQSKLPVMTPDHYLRSLNSIS